MNKRKEGRKERGKKERKERNKRRKKVEEREILPLKKKKKKAVEKGSVRIPETTWLSGLLYLESP